ncbi:beta-lactamase-like protein [Penicillium angulare]|uniref:Beta-lactamase-like protein n=1 Tax=Penicillium angulare TaxID=116970 RepID=A0A9W9FTU2_9EURO|nr:beta-lactamase-like protein [Penicillium angulare]
MKSILQADVYVSSRLPLAVKRLGESSCFSPISCTLIHGDSEAVLVDTPISISQTEDLVAWIKATAPGKDLRYIYITHGHGDQWFGASILRKHWPNLRVLATPGTIEHMEEQLKPEIFEGTWLTLFPGDQIPKHPEVAEAMSSSVFNIEGHEFRAIEVGLTDTYNTTVLYVPSIRIVVAEMQYTAMCTSSLEKQILLKNGCNGCMRWIRLRHWIRIQLLLGISVQEQLMDFLTCTKRNEIE